MIIKIDAPEVEKKDVIDWSKKGQLLVYSNGDILISTGVHTDDRFEGFDIKELELYDLYVKSSFTLLPSTKIVQLQND